MNWRHFTAILVLVMSGTQAAFAIPFFLSEWRELYPDSSSDQRDCQLCHALETGDEPWNTYGFEIRETYIEIFGSIDIRAAIRAVEPNNSDNDPNGLSNIDEINAGLDPGWAPGPVNFWVYKNGDAVGGQLPPFPELNVEDNFCFPLKIDATETAVILCL